MTSAAPTRGCAPALLAQVDALACDRDRREEGRRRVVRRRRRACRRSGCGRRPVHVEQPRVRREGVCDGVDRCAVAALAEVRNRLEREHGAYSRRGDPGARADRLPLARVPPAARTAAAAHAPRRASRSSRFPSSRGRAGQRVPLRAGARRRRGRGAPPMARPRGADAAPLARARRGRFYATFYCSSVTRCYPGRPPSGRGDRTPTPHGERPLRRWRDEELRLLRPGWSSPSAASRSASSWGCGAWPSAVGGTFRRSARRPDPAPAPVRRERPAERAREPGARRGGRGARPRGASPLPPRCVVLGG